MPESTAHDGNRGVDPRLKAEYDTYYTGAEAEWRSLAALDKARNIARLCAPVPHETILEIGCGDGAILAHLSREGFGRALYGIEISQSGLERVREREIPRLAECRLFDGETVPYEDNTFDIAVLSHVVEHLEYPRWLLREAGRAARHVFVEVPLEDNVLLRPDAGPHDTVGHINWYNYKTIRRLAQTSGLEVRTHILRPSSLAVHRYIHGWKGLFIYVPKAVLIRAMPPLARLLFTYNSSMLCSRAHSG